MAGKSPEERRALDDLSARLLTSFGEQGFGFIDPDILQPADVFLDRSGEDLRSRTFVFSDPDGRELCLRPDLTVPACRYHLARFADDPGTEAQYCYSGPAFRYQGASGDGEHKPAEFQQCGIEWFAARDKQAAEAEVLSGVLKALEAAGLEGHAVTIGDLTLFHALLRSIEIPGRWRRRLKHQFWRPRAFRSLLNVLSGNKPRPRTSISPLIDGLKGGALEPALVLVEGELAARSSPLVGGRTTTEIAERLAEKAADRTATPIGKRDVEAIDTYLAIRGKANGVVTELDALARDVNGPFAEAVTDFKRRNELLSATGVDPARLEFAAVFGRSLEYYTGFVFQIDKRDSEGRNLSIAGGGRYDDMISDIAGCEEVPAVGCAIYIERLLATLRGAA